MNEYLYFSPYDCLILAYNTACLLMSNGAVRRLRIHATCRRHSREHKRRRFSVVRADERARADMATNTNAPDAQSLKQAARESAFVYEPRHRCRTCVDDHDDGDDDGDEERRWRARARAMSQTNYEIVDVPNRSAASSRLLRSASWISEP